MLRILFLCVENSARSQMAEALARKMLPPGYEIFSAGSSPSGKIHPKAIEVMSELSLDMNKQRSKSIDDLPKEFLNKVDFVVRLCQEEVCPTLPVKPKKNMSWPFANPTALPDSQQLDAFRKIRDQLEDKIKNEFKTFDES